MLRLSTMVTVPRKQLNVTVKKVGCRKSQGYSESLLVGKAQTSEVAAMPRSGM